MFKSVIEKILEHYVVVYIRKHQVKLVVVVGSVGKTTTKIAIATVVGEKFRTRTHEGNHNTHLSAPLAILGVEYPDNIRSIREWINVYKAIKLRINGPKDTDLVIQELGTDRPGDIPAFAKYLSPDIAVITSVGLEHMESFKTIEAVAKEELAIVKKAKLTIVNRDDVDEDYAKYADTNQISTYGTSEKSEYRIDADYSDPLSGAMGTFISPDWDPVSVNLQLIGEHNVRAAAAAGAVGAKLGLQLKDITVGMAKIQPVKGRMNVLRGVGGSTIIDDSYNSSPMAVAAALKTLYATKSDQRIAILGSMNEFGDLSTKAHNVVGKLCDPKLLDWVVTIGDEAREHLAPVAKENGCQVRSFSSPYQAGGFVHSVLKPGSIVLVKGSQNGVFSEEAVKVLLHDSTDEKYLVRQSESWMSKKQLQFEQPIDQSDDA